MDNFMLAEKHECLNEGGIDLLVLQNPIVLLARSQRISIMILGWGIFLLYIGSSSIQSFETYGEMQNVKYRIEGNVSEPQGFRFSDAVTIQILKNTYTSIIDESSNMDFRNEHDSFGHSHGYRLVPTEPNITLTISFILFGMADTNKSWNPVGANSFRYTASGIKITNGGKVVLGPSGMDFDYRPPWPLVFLLGWTRVALGIVLTAMSSMSITLGQQHYTRRTVGVGLLSTSSLLCASTIGFLLTASYLEAILAAMYALTLCLLGIALISAPVNEEWGVLALVSLSFLLGWLLERPVLGDLPSAPGPLGQDIAVSFSFGFLTVPFTLRRAFLVLDAALRDADRLERLWRSRVAGVAALRPHLRRLERQASEIARACEHARGVRQMFVPYRLPPGSPTRRASFTRRKSLENRAASDAQIMPADASPRGVSHIRSLTLLYTQAAADAAVLTRLAREWAASGDALGHGPYAQLRCDGAGPQAKDRRSEGEPAQAGLRLDVHAGDCSLDRMLRLGVLKRPRRAALKALACYGGDVSRLLDICRLRFWFGSVDGLSNCLAAIAADSRVEIVRIKNTMLEQLPAVQHAGFRGVILNVRLLDEQSSAVENHICELQLVLNDFRVIEDPEAHRRYLYFRDMRDTARLGIRLLLGALRLLRDQTSPDEARGESAPNVSEAVQEGCAQEVCPAIVVAHGPRLSCDEDQAASLQSCANTQQSSPPPPPHGLQGQHVQSPGRDSPGDLMGGGRVGCAGAAEGSAERVEIVVDAGVDSLREQNGGWSTALQSRCTAERPGPARNGWTTNLSPDPDTSRIGPVPIQPAFLDASGGEHHGAAEPVSDGEGCSVGTRDAAIQDVYRRMVTRPLTSAESSLGKDSLLNAGSILFISQPVSVSSSRPVFQLLGLALAAFFAQRAVDSVGTTLQDGAFAPSPRRFRLRVAGLRDPALDPSRANAFDLGLLRGGDPLGSLGGYPARARTNGSRPAALAFPFPVAANGYYLAIPAGDPRADPVRWTLETCPDAVDPCGWAAAGGSAWHGAGQSGQFSSRMAFPVPTKRGALVAVDHRPPWADGFIDVAPNFFMAVGWLAYAGCGRAGRIGAARVCLGSAFGLSSLACALAAAGYAARGDYFYSGLAALFVFADFPVFLALLWRERYFLQAIMAFGIFSFANLAARITHWTPLEDTQLSSWFYSLGFICFAFTNVVFMFRRFALHRARSLVLDDKNKYDAVWSGIIADPGEHGAVESLCHEVSEMDARLAGLPRHLNRAIALSLTSLSSSREVVQASRRVCSLVRSPFGGPGRTPRASRLWDRVFDCGVAGTADPHRPVASFEQLYFQALAVHPLLIDKVKAWAGASGGYFLSMSVNGGCAEVAPHGSAGTVVTSAALLDSSKWSSAHVEFVQWGGADDDVMVRWCSVKSPRRAMEKVTRMYEQDCSRLLDLCRQSIYFRTVADVVRCLQAVKDDPDVVLVRVKNRLDPAYNSAHSAGFRNLSFNLRIVSRETKDLGLENHVAEVQLMLIPMACIKNDDGHRKYIAFRNLRGE